MHWQRIQSMFLTVPSGKRKNSARIIQRFNGHKRLIRGDHNRVRDQLRFRCESIKRYAEINGGNTLAIMSYYPIMFSKN